MYLQTRITPIGFNKILKFSCQTLTCFCVSLRAHQTLMIRSRNNTRAYTSRLNSAAPPPGRHYSSEPPCARYTSTSLYNIQLILVQLAPSVVRRRRSLRPEHHLRTKSINPHSRKIPPYFFIMRPILSDGRRFRTS